MSVGDTASDSSEEIENSDKLATTIGHAGAFDDNSSDSLEQLQQERAKKEGEHEGLRGLSNWLYSKAGLERGYAQEIPEAQARADGLTIMAAQERKLDEHSGLAYANLQTGLRAAQLNLAGDPRAAQRQQFEQDQANQWVGLIDQYGDASDQVRVFDQKSALEREELQGKQARGRQEMQSELSGAIADKGEVHEAQLQAAGNTYEADRDQFIRTGQDKARILHEQDTSSDAIGQAQLLPQAEARQKADTQQVAANVEAQNQHSAARELEHQQEMRDEQLETPQADPNAAELADIGQFEALRENFIERRTWDSTDSGSLAADRANAEARIGQFVSQTQNAGAGRIMPAEQYGNSLLTAALHGDGAANALGLAGDDLKTLGGGAALGNLGEVGQKLSAAADKWNYIADHMRNVTILTMGR